MSRADNISAWVRAGTVKSRSSRSGQGMTCFKSRDCFNKKSVRRGFGSFPGELGIGSRVR